MDLRVTITDENGTCLGVIVVYQDGSDAEGTLRIINYIRENFTEDIGGNVIKRDAKTGVIWYPKPPKMTWGEWYAIHPDYTGDHDHSMEDDDG